MTIFVSIIYKIYYHMTCMSHGVVFNAWRMRDKCILCKIYRCLVYIVGVISCDQNGWLKESYLIHDDIH